MLFKLQNTITFYKQLLSSLQKKNSSQWQKEANKEFSIIRLDFYAAKLKQTLRIISNSYSKVPINKEYQFEKHLDIHVKAFTPLLKDVI